MQALTHHCLVVESVESAQRIYCQEQTAACTMQNAELSRHHKLFCVERFWYFAVCNAMLPQEMHHQTMKLTELEI